MSYFDLMMKLDKMPADQQMITILSQCSDRLYVEIFHWITETFDLLVELHGRSDDHLSQWDSSCRHHECLCKLSCQSISKLLRYVPRPTQLAWLKNRSQNYIVVHKKHCKSMS